MALPRHSTPATAQPRWDTSTSASSRRSAAPSPPSSPASSSSAPSSPPTTPVRSARPATSPAACTPSLWAPSAPRPSTPASRSPTAPSWRLPTCRPTTWSPACSLPPTCSAPAGSPPSRPRPEPGKTVAVVGDGAVGLLAVLAAQQLGAERIIVMSRHESRQKLAREFGATDIVTERGDEGVARIKGLDRRARRALGDRSRRHPGVDDAGHPLHPPRRPRRLRRRLPRRLPARRRAVLRRRPPARRTRPGPALPARAHRPDLEPARSTPARSSTSTYPSTRPPEAYRAMDERRAIKALLRP